MSSDMLTVRQVADLLQCSVETVARRFAHLDGVTNIATPGKRRNYRVLRIPLAVVEKYARRRFDLSKPAPPTPTRKPLTEDELTRELARLGVDAVKKISNRAKFLALHVPLEDWEGLVWLDDENDFDAHGRIVPSGPLNK